MAKRVRYVDHSGTAIVQLSAGMADLAEAAAAVIVEEIQSEIDAGGAGGREYVYIADRSREDWRRTPDKHAKGEHFRASAPGEAPAQPTLKYRNSWHASSAGRRGRRIVALAFSKAKTSTGESLAAALEYGTERMDPRPHIRKALERAVARIHSMVSIG